MPNKLIVFNNATIDGYIADRSGDMHWAHKQDPEWTDFVIENANRGGTLLFGRVTYEMMASYWPTPQAAANMPTVAHQMNKRPKVVFSNTLTSAGWNNTTLMQGDLPEQVRQLKKTAEGDLAILGSASLVFQLTQARLVDEYQIIVHPVILGAGKSMFAGLDRKLDLKLITSRTFHNGNVLLRYAA